MAFGKDGMKYKVVFKKDVSSFSVTGQDFRFEKETPGYIPHWELEQAKRRGAKILEVVGTPEQKINYYPGGFDGV